MKPLFAAIDCLLFTTCLVFAGCDLTCADNVPQRDNRGGLVRVEITDKTDIHYYKDGKTARHNSITKPDELKALQVELYLMKEVQNMNIKDSMGCYDMILYFKDGTSQQAGLIYTVYDGLIYHNDSTNKSYKTSEMEALVRSYF